jgi:DNA-binding response OmpR family regulator
VARVVALAPDLFFGSKIDATLRAAGHDVRLVGTGDEAGAAAADADVFVVDLHAPGLDAGQLVTTAAGKPVLGFYSHVDEAARDRGRDAGFALVVPRSRMAREMPELVAGLVDAQPPA